MLQIACRLGRAVGHADLVHCHLYGLLTLAVGLTARARLRPVVCKAAIAGRGSDIGEMKRTSFFNRRVAGWGRWCFTRWIATTDAVADQLRSAGVETARIVKIPNGIALRPGPKIVSRVRRFLYVGRLSSNINRDTDGLLSAFDRVADKHADVHLALVGGGDLLDHTRLLAASARHADRIQVVGFADPTPWLQWADCFVLPSRNEGLSNALLEAMERGLVCVANDIGPNREALADGRAGILVPVEDRVCLAETLQSLIADDAVASDFSRAARGRAESAYGMEAVVSLVQHAYSKLHAWSS
jgi:glycosyltransferase involved in cell wall biosynthesis